MSQLSHEENPFPEQKFPVVLILDNVNSPANIGSIFRLADAFNIESLVICGAGTKLGSNRLLRTARSTVARVNHLQRESTLVTCSEYLDRGYELFAVEITSDSIPIHRVDFQRYSRCALVVGNENTGIDSKILQLTHQRLHITMFGKNSSMNVAQATGIALYEITKSLSGF